MQRLVGQSEFEALAKSRQRELSINYYRNRGKGPGAPGDSMKIGLARADFLGQHTHFVGIVRDDSFVKEKHGHIPGAVLVVMLSS